MKYAYFLIGSVSLYFLIGMVRVVLCWPAIRYEMTKQDQRPGMFSMVPEIKWILPRPLCFGIYSGAWFMWKDDYKDMRAASRLERLSAKARHNN